MLEIVIAIEVNSLVPIIPHIKILVWGKTSHGYLWYTPLLQEHNLAIGLVYKTKSLVSNWWEFGVKGFFDKPGHGWSRDAVLNNFQMKNLKNSSL